MSAPREGYPRLPAELIFNPLEWEAAYCLNKQPLPQETTSLNDAFHQIARLWTGSWGERVANRVLRASG